MAAREAAFLWARPTQLWPCGAGSSETSEQSDVRVEYKIRPVTRYIVTRYHETSGPGGAAGGCECKGEFDNPESAYQVGYALAKHDHELLGYPPGDDRLQYPERPPAINEATDPVSKS